MSMNHQCRPVTGGGSTCDAAFCYYGALLEKVAETHIRHRSRQQAA
jgi:hypothetical protein